jgi:hypothetical protein
MKKLILSLVLAVAAFAANAQNHTTASFFAGGVGAVYATNTLNITNLLFPGLTVTTNWPGVSYTNKNTLLTVTGGVAAAQNLLSAVGLWTDRNGSPVGVWGYTNAGSLQVGTPTFCNISGSFTCGSSANTAVQFTFKPVYESDGGGAPRQASMSSTTPDEWTFGILAVVSTRVTFATNAPTWLWPGAAGLVCVRIVNADADASSQVIIDELNRNGFKP